MARRPRTVSLDPAAEEILAGVGNASAYLSRIVQDRDAKWRSALTQLRMAGWRCPELLAACDALNGVWLRDPLSQTPGAIALELSDSQSINDICAKWDVSPDTWDARIRTLADGLHNGIAAALVSVVDEFWADNSACEAAIRAAK